MANTQIHLAAAVADQCTNHFQTSGFVDFIFKYAITDKVDGMNLMLMSGPKSDIFMYNLRCFLDSGN